MLCNAGADKGLVVSSNPEVPRSISAPVNGRVTTSRAPRPLAWFRSRRSQLRPLVRWARCLNTRSERLLLSEVRRAGICSPPMKVGGPQGGQGGASVTEVPDTEGVEEGPGAQALPVVDAPFGSGAGCGRNRERRGLDHPCRPGR